MLRVSGGVQKQHGHPDQKTSGALGHVSPSLLAPDLVHLRFSNLLSLQDVENIAALPVEAAEAEAMLRENANLLHVRVAHWLNCANIPNMLARHHLHAFAPTVAVILYWQFPFTPHPPLLAQVYEMLACLEGTSMKAQQALESGTNVSVREAQGNLSSYFQKARAAVGWVVRGGREVLG